MGDTFILWAGLVVIGAVMAPLIQQFSDKAAAGATGVLSGFFILYYMVRTDSELWGWALLATLAAMALYIAGLVRSSNELQWTAFAVGLFGTLIPVITGIKQRVNPDPMTIPWGWLIIGMGVLLGLLYLSWRRHSSDTT